MNRRTGFLVLFLGFYQIGFSQPDTIYNVNSAMFKTAERIAYYEQLYRFRVVRFMDLKEKQNKAFSSKRSDIGGLIIDLVKSKKIKAYSNFSAFGDPADFETVVSDSVAINLDPIFVMADTKGFWNATSAYQATEKVVVRQADDKGEFDNIVYEATADNTGKEPTTNGDVWNKLVAMNKKLSPAIVAGLDITEDVIFDKRKSRLTYDILALGICYKDEKSGQILTRFIVKYSDLAAQIEKLARSKKPSERASVMWQNRYNPSENKKFTDAFKLREFHGIIKKVENPDGLTILETIFSKEPGKERGSYAEGVFAMWEQEMKMMEKEHNLWEY